MLSGAVRVDRGDNLHMGKVAKNVPSERRVERADPWREVCSASVNDIA